MALRILIYDGTPKKGETALRTAWATGARVYRALGRIDAFHGAKSWSDALHWLISFRPEVPIAEIQYWGHGRWGEALIADDRLDASSFEPGSALTEPLRELRQRLLPEGGSLVWFRTCETFGATRGQAFARRITDALGTRAAGHTHVIGALQSGLHGLRPRERPHWSAEEGLAAGTADAPLRALGSSPDAPHTIHFMNGRFDPAWFDE